LELSLHHGREPTRSIPTGRAASRKTVGSMSPIVVTPPDYGPEWGK
jgi:hypothetical protein